ncbi:Septin-type guanine nucleotide-binding (G) domain-containing protein [Gorgonomyces haynaldii]|nr:Septin-type guanine nucleotide-binding (G) domain-containing protein [Gorgonomyces haynaldii]
MLGLVDTPGLDIPAGVHRIASDEQLSLNAEKYAQQLLDFIENAFEDTLLSESKIVRDRTALDRQVHCMLYLINPDIILSCKGLSFMDKIVLEKMQKRVNVIPCIGKSDLVTVRDLKTIRQYLKNDLLQNDIHVYNFEPEEDENGELVDLNDKLPFCLVNSEMLDDGQGLPMMGVQKGDQMILGREYIWGVVECENPNHCDFTLLKDLLFGGYMDDLRQETNQILYEQWRTERLSARRESIAVPASIKDKMRLEE